MNQIKVKELPIGYFVSSIYYLSGNKEFISLGYRTPDKKGLTMHCGSCYENVREFWCNEYNDYVCRDCAPFDTNVLGTKHIQLVAANPTFEMEQLSSMGDYMLLFDKFQFNLTQEQYEMIYKLKEQGKDFFIYKVSDKKCL